MTIKIKENFALFNGFTTGVNLNGENFIQKWSKEENYDSEKHSQTLSGGTFDCADDLSAVGNEQYSGRQ